MGGDLRGGFEEVAHVDREAEIGEGGGDDLGAAIVAVLAHLSAEDRRRAVLLVREGGNPRLHLGILRIAPVAVAIDAGDDTRDGVVTAEDILQRPRDLAQSGADAGSTDSGTGLSTMPSPDSYSPYGGATGPFPTAPYVAPQTQP